MLVLQQLALLVSLAALAVAATRAAAALGARGLELAVAAPVLGAAVAGAESLALGLFGLGGSPVALMLAAVATAAAATRAWPAAGAGASLGVWWARRSPAQRRMPGGPTRAAPGLGGGA